MTCERVFTLRVRSIDRIPEEEHCTPTVLLQISSTVMFGPLKQYIHQTSEYLIFKQLFRYCNAMNDRQVISEVYTTFSYSSVRSIEHALTRPQGMVVQSRIKITQG